MFVHCYSRHLLGLSDGRVNLQTLFSQVARQGQMQPEKLQQSMQKYSPA